MRRCRDWIGPQSARWTFDPPDFEKFPLLKLAYQAQETGGSATCTLNAADEIAVEAFLAGRIPFPGNCGDRRGDAGASAGAGAALGRRGAGNRPRIAGRRSWRLWRRVSTRRTREKDTTEAALHA